MTHPHFSKLKWVLPLLCCAGCIFGGKTAKNNDTDPNNANNSTTNNSTTQSNNDTPDLGAPDAAGRDVGDPPDLGPPDLGPPDMGPMEVYAELSATEVACPSPNTAWYDPAAAALAPSLNDAAVVSAATAPTLAQGLTSMPFGEISTAYATSVGGSVRVHAGVGTVSTVDSEITMILEGASALGVDADVLAVHVQPGFFSRPDANGEPAPVLTISVSTSAGFYDCLLTIDSNDAGGLTCQVSALDAELSARNLRPNRVDYAPIFERRGGSYILNILALDVLALVSAETATGEQIAAIRREADATISDVALTGLPRMVDAPLVYAERTVWGVTNASFGQPTLLALAEVDRSLAPVRLDSAGAAGTEYVVDSFEDFHLSSRVFPERGTFTFIDGYEGLQVATHFSLIPLEAGYNITPGQSRLGYVGITQDGLVFGRPGGFSVADYLEMDLLGAQEVAAFKNVPADPLADGTPPIAVIHGANRDQLALIDWGFGIDARWVADLLAPGFTNARKINGWWFLDDAGVLPMLAERNGNLVLAVTQIADAANLAANCQ